MQTFNSGSLFAATFSTSPVLDAVRFAGRKGQRAALGTFPDALAFCVVRSAGRGRGNGCASSGAAYVLRSVVNGGGGVTNFASFGTRGCRRWWRPYHGVMVRRAEDLEAVRKQVACIALAPYQAAALDQLRLRALRERFD